MTEFEMIEAEIAPKGKCYLICNRFDPADFEQTLEKMCDTAVDQGAHTVYFACRDAHNTLDENAFCVGRYAFTFYSSFDVLSKNLADTLPASAGLLRCKPLRESNAELWIELYNESFYDVPNSRTMTDQEAAAVIEEEKRSGGFFMVGGEPVGVFELNYEETAPEIAAICIRPGFRGQGYGTKALEALEARLANEGHAVVELLVAGANRRAKELYEAHGYSFARHVSRWYQAAAMGNDI